MNEKRDLAQHSEMESVSQRASYEMLLRLLKVAELLNKGQSRPEKQGYICKGEASTSNFSQNDLKNYN